MVTHKTRLIALTILSILMIIAGVVTGLFFNGLLITNNNGTQNYNNIWIPLVLGSVGISLAFYTKFNWSKSEKLVETINKSEKLVETILTATAPIEKKSLLSQGNEVMNPTDDTNKIL